MEHVQWAACHTARQDRDARAALTGRDTKIRAAVLATDKVLMAVMARMAPPRVLSVDGKSTEQAGSREEFAEIPVVSRQPVKANDSTSSTSCIGRSLCTAWPAPSRLEPEEWP